MKIKRIEHVAIVVDKMAPGMKMLEDVFGLKLDYVQETALSKLAMYPVGDSSLELIETKSADSRSGQWLARNGQSLYHLCFEVDDILAAIEELKAKGIKLQDEVPKPGHGGSQIVFLDQASTGTLLIELVQMPAQAAH